MASLRDYKKVFMDVLGVEESVLNEDFTFKNVPQWDSVAHLSLISELEDTFDIMFDSEDILHFGSYLNGIEIMKHYGITME